MEKETDEIAADYSPGGREHVYNDIKAKYEDKLKALDQREETVVYSIEMHQQGSGSEDEGSSKEAEAKKSENSTSTKKRKAEESDDTKPSETKRFKQDSNDINGDTEPSDFTGGDD